MTLTNPTDDELDAAFAEKVAGWRGPLHPETLALCDEGMRKTGLWWLNPDGKLTVLEYTPIPNFTRSMDAVLPWLERHHWSCRSHGMSGSTHGYPHCTVTVAEFPVAEHPERFGLQHEGHCFSGDSIATALPRSCVIALLRANGVEVVFKP